MTNSECSFQNCLYACVVFLKSRTINKQVVDEFSEILTVLFNYIVNENPPSYETLSNDACDYLPLGPLASKVINSKFLSKLVPWCATAEYFSPEIKYFVLQNLLRKFDFLISQAKQNLLFSAAFFQPLLKLVDLCRESSDHLSENLSCLLYTLTVLLCRDPVLLEFSKQVSRDVTRNEYFIFSCLVPLLHLQGSPGDNSRDALLLILALSYRDAEVANYLTSKSDICPVLATGLSGYYSCLPKRLVLNGIDSGQTPRSPEALYVNGAGWHRITRSEWSTCEPLVHFLQILDVCNLAVRISHQSVRQYLLYYIYSGFLMSVLRSALNQEPIDERIAAEAYLELFIRRLTEPALVGLFLRFIVASTDENESVLSSLISRLADDSTLGMVTLSLFRTILNLNCEDIMFLLVFRYLNKLKTVNQCVVSGKKQQDADRPSNSNHLSWLASSELFLKLTFWCTGYKGSVETSYLSNYNPLGCAPSDRLAVYLLAARRLVESRMCSTGMWSIKYQPPVSVILTAPNAEPPPIVLLHSTPLSTKMTSSLRIESDSRQQELSIIDRYKSESNIYQLSYCDDSDEELEQEKKLEAPRHRVNSNSMESPTDLESSQPERSPLDVIRQIVAELDFTPPCDPVSLFTEALDKHFPIDNDEFGTNLPYPPVDHFTLNLLDYRLGKCASSVVTTPKPSPKNVAVGTVGNPESDYDFERLYGNELPDIPYRSAFGECSSLTHSTNDLGPFLNCVLDRIGSMHKNSLYVNLLLTDIVSILASFHHFPLADFLLRCSDVNLRAPGRSLYQVLMGLRLELEQHLAEITNWPALVDKAMCFLLGSGLRTPEPLLPPAVAMTATPDFATDADLLALGAFSPPQVRNRSSSAHPPRGYSPAMTSTSRTAVLEPVLPPSSRIHRPRQSSPKHLHTVHHTPAALSPSQCPPPTPTIPTSTRNVIFTFIVFNELCLQLAGFCFENGVSASSVQPQFEKTMELERCLADF